MAKKVQAEQAQEGLQPEWLTTRQVSILTGISASSIRRLQKTGDFVEPRVLGTRGAKGSAGHAHRYSLAEVRRFMEGEPTPAEVAEQGE